MKKFLLMLFALSLYGQVNAFSVLPTDVHERMEKAVTENPDKAKFIRDYVKAFDGYDVEFEYNRKMIVITCPYDHGITKYAINNKAPTLVKSTDTCEHVLAFELPNMKVYRDDIPYLIADDYCAWLKGPKNSAFPKVWDLYAK